MRVCHVESVTFDDPNLVSCAGLAPVLALAQRCGLADLVGEHLTLTARPGVNAHLKVGALVAAMVAGADSIADTDLLRHGAMGRLFGGVRAPSTLGSFLRCFTFGHVRQLDAVAARLTAQLSRHCPLLPGADQLAFVDIDDTVKATYGYAKQGAGYGYSGVKGLNALLATVSTPLAAPVIVATRLRKGSANSARGAGRLVADALNNAKATGAGGPAGTGLIVLRADSAYYTHDVVAAARRAGARFSITARASPAVSRAIERIDQDAWTAISYPHAVWDEQAQCLVSDAEIAEVPFTAFTSRRKADHISARLLVRRVNASTPPARPSRLPARPVSRASCSRSTATTACSPIARSPWSRPRSTTVGTPSSNRSTPTCGPVRSLICPQGRFRRTVPGWSWPRSRSTSPAPPAASPRPSTPKPPPARSAPNSSTSRRGSPAPHDASDCTCPSTGPGRPPGNTCSRPPSPPADPPSRPDNRTTVETPGTPAAPPRPKPSTTLDKIKTATRPRPPTGAVHPGSAGRQRQAQRCKYCC